eukprot:14551028-Alexandrium_andersonii.AAC.1
MERNNASTLRQSLSDVEPEISCAGVAKWPAVVPFVAIALRGGLDAANVRAKCAFGNALREHITRQGLASSACWIAVALRAS